MKFAEQEEHNGNAGTSLNWRRMTVKVERMTRIGKRSTTMTQKRTLKVIKIASCKKKVNIRMMMIECAFEAKDLGDTQWLMPDVVCRFGDRRCCSCQVHLVTGSEAKFIFFSSAAASLAAPRTLTCSSSSGASAGGVPGRGGGGGAAAAAGAAAGGDGACGGKK